VTQIHSLGPAWKPDGLFRIVKSDYNRKKPLQISEVHPSNARLLISLRIWLGVALIAGPLRVSYFIGAPSIAASELSAIPLLICFHYVAALRTTAASGDILRHRKE
jgi:hypothetical protein